jgi:hypothetical protein
MTIPPQFPKLKAKAYRHSDRETISSRKYYPFAAAETPECVSEVHMPGKRRQYT